IESAVPEPSQNLTPIRVNPPVVAPRVPLASDPSQKRSVSSVAKIANAVFTYEEVTAEPPLPPVIQSDPPIETTLPPETFSSSQTESLDAITIETELGGIFYLINLAIFMEIDTELSIWDFIAFVGAELNQYRNED